MASVTLQSISKSFGATEVLSGIDLAIADGEFLTLVGASGCGKSTLIRIIAGLEPQTSGSVLIDGKPVDHLRPHERHLAMVFQSYALYPHMRVFGNIALPLVMSRLNLAERLPVMRLFSPRRRRVMAEIERDVRAVAKQLQIEALLDRRPAQLSGGQRQRVALGRAMVRQPAAFLMDEPLSNLDAKLRVHMRSELAELHARLGTTFIYVTHDQVEAMTMSDRVAMMDGGTILQLGRPSELYARPASIKVAQFIGTPAINLLPANAAADGTVELFGSALPLRMRRAGALTLGIRPEAIVAAPPGTQRAGLHMLPARLRRSENLGAEHILHADLVAPASGTIVCSYEGDPDELTHDARGIALLFPPDKCHLFDADGQRVDFEPAVASVRALHA
ncbi:MAG TPA: ABC transporter ATP-binding protein [Casimicrobiaceae bacterium]|jgi:multiple sugar transport system ATP-binding protein|nr:ABC transporter ATP-binding protein [Casimicrobiaceae bacterium]